MTKLFGYAKKTTSTLNSLIRRSPSSRPKISTLESPITSGTMSLPKNNNAMKRSAKHEKKNEDGSKERRNNNETSLRNKRPQRCNRSALNARKQKQSAAQLKKSKTALTKRKKTRQQLNSKKQKMKLKSKSKRIRPKKTRMLITKMSLKPRIQLERSARGRIRREELKTVRRTKRPRKLAVAEVEVAVRKPSLVQSKSGKRKLRILM